MKVALLKSQVFRIGGLEKYTLRLAQAFARKGCEVSILTTDGTIAEKHKDSPFEFVPIAKNSKLSIKQIVDFDIACKNWLKKNTYDVVFGMERTTQQTHYRAGSGVHATFLKRRQLVDSTFKQFSFKLNPLHHLILNYEKKCFESSDLKILFTNSLMVKQEVLEHYKINNNKIRVVHNGVEWNEMEKSFEESFSQPNLKNSLGLDPNCFQFLFIGNGYKRKGLTFLLQGLEQLTTQDFQLSIVGKEKNMKEFHALAKKYNLENKVKFFGPQKDISCFYKACDSLVIPSIYDPFANVTLEALAMGLFVVSSGYNGGIEILNSETGSVIDVLSDPKSVAYSLEKALKMPKTLKSAKKIRESVKDYDFTHQLDKIVNLTISN